ncbi:site-specific integrase [Roseibacterium beibuensis]|uniref:site-specific integrase n=1 Tax=[Roseibacterium] beibuensis TaxID=1193142 RepID=UPI00217CE228|nr:site-specific integrase [Roseibacterium beibuensis]MCS6625398.1 site-specific integrase [Roseibacterium beibuensis]
MILGSRQLHLFEESTIMSISPSRHTGKRPSVVTRQRVAKDRAVRLRHSSEEGGQAVAVTAATPRLETQAHRGAGSPTCNHKPESGIDQPTFSSMATGRAPRSRSLVNTAATQSGGGRDGPTTEAGPAGPPTVPQNLRELLDLLEAEPVKDRKVVETSWAINQVALLLRKPLQNIPTEPVLLRPLIKAATPASLEITPARWSRLKSLLAFGLRRYGIELQPARDVAGHAPAWKTLASIAPDRACLMALSRFMSFCSRAGILPDAVTEQVFADFTEALQNRSLHHEPSVISRKAISSWNRAVATVPEWPQTAIPLERHSRFYSFAWAEFPASFGKDVEDYLAQCAVTDIWSEHSKKASRPKTIELRRKQLRQLASLLALSGLPIEEITSLAVLTKLANARAALKHQEARKNGVVPRSLAEHAWLLGTIARNWTKDPVSAEALGNLALRLQTAPREMTERNTTRMRQFKVQANVDALLTLPARVFAEADGAPTVTPKIAQRVACALAVDLLTVMPLRINNLTGLEFDRHIIVLGRGKRQEMLVVIPAAEFKTGKTFEMRVPHGVAERVNRFMERYHPLLAPQGAAQLFVSPKGGRRSTIAFSRAISSFMKHETGLVMNAHLFRSLAGKLHLEEHPEDMETVRRLLGHERSETTHRYYVEARTTRHMQLYTDMIEQRRAKAAAAQPIKIRRKAAGK